MKLLPVTVLFALLCCARPLGAQELRYIDHTYVDNVKSVRLTVAGIPSSYPLIELGAGRLQLSFDDWEDEVKRYTYAFIHCDQDWQPSNLGPLEYNSGYANDVIDDYDFSIRTLRRYVHYDLVFPNRNMRLERSGNYLLVVYDSEGREDRPVITRRFMVYEAAGGASGAVMRSAAVGKIHTHQEVDLAFNTKQLRPRAPLREISATVLQNGRWDNAVVGIAPSMLGRERVEFNYQGVVSFAGGNEFRNLDFRSVVAPRTKLADFTNEGDHYAMLLAPLRERANSVYLQYADFNGDFIVDGSEDQILSLRADNFAFTGRPGQNFDFTGDYLELTVVLEAPRDIDRDLYAFGAATEWQLKPGYRMVWNPHINAYVGRFFVKQGFYNFYFVTDEGAAGRAERNLGGDAGAKGWYRRVGYEQTEDSFFETENDYLGLIYYRPQGGRYDRLVGVTRLNSEVN